MNFVLSWQNMQYPAYAQMMTTNSLKKMFPVNTHYKLKVILSEGRSPDTCFVVVSFFVNIFHFFLYLFPGITCIMDKQDVIELI